MSAEIVRAYATGVGSVVVGKRMGISYKTVLSALKRAGVPILRHGGSGGRRERVSDAVARRVVNLYHQDRWEKVVTIAARCGVATGAIYSILRRTNPDLKPKRVRGRRLIQFSKKELTALLTDYKKGCGLVALAESHQVSITVVARALREAGVILRGKGRPKLLRSCTA